MTREEFESLVARLEERARKNPSAYRMRVLALAFAGYGYLAFVVALLVALFVLAVALIHYSAVLGAKIAFAIGVFLYVVCRALWVKIEPPTGIDISREYAPALFELIDGIRAKLGSKHFHHVMVTNEFNAAVVQVPRLGIFGWHRNYLLIGLPLMKSLTPAQLEAVLAHEFGHLAGGHGRFGNWIYRLRLSWHRLLFVLQEQKSAGSFLFTPFFRWYEPYFSAYSFPLARANEYEADAASARAVSAKAAAEALTNVEVAASYLGERFWPGIHRNADDMPRPSFSPFSMMGERFSSEFAPDDAQRWLQAALAHTTTTENTHPSLSDRLRALNEEARLAPPAPGQAADTLLGRSLERITALLDEEWTKAVLPSWEERHEHTQKGRKRLASLEGKATVTMDEAIERARLTEDFGAGADAAFEQWKQIRERAPDDKIVGLLLGKRLLARDDESGLALVEAALTLDEQSQAAASEVLRDYYWRKGRHEEARQWHERFLEADHVLDSARRERATVLTSDKFDRHGLAEETIVDIRRKLAAIPGLRKAYLVRKRVKYLPDQPMFALGFVVTPWWRRQDKKAAATVRDAIVKDVEFPHYTMVFCVEGGNYPFGRKFRFMRGTRVF